MYIGELACGLCHRIPCQSILDQSEVSYAKKFPIIKKKENQKTYNLFFLIAKKVFCFKIKKLFMKGNEVKKVYDTIHA